MVKLNKLFVITLFLLLSNSFKSQHLTSVDMVSVCQNFNDLNNTILNNTINKKSAVLLFKFQLQLINKTYKKQVGFDTNLTQLVFPIQGYNYKAIGGKNGNGYLPAGFNYFDGNNHKGHAAHDIFINDKNQDELDDKTFKPVNILAMSSGVVIAMSQKWDSTSTVRGGKFIYVYNPTSNFIYYYAHCKDIKVKIGDVIKPKQVIATVGRTGLNAFKKRSPTHLHLMVLKLDAHFYPKPINSYNLLLKSKF
ncbi:MAG: M23 family metallopeptidase [Bacteroidia bacterium]|nr:M23 family metallopeptidase [Bacteroidia bacterium]